MSVSRGLLALAIGTVISAAAFAGDAKSGPEKGSPASAFDVRDFTGRFKGQKLCYV